MIDSLAVRSKLWRCGVDVEIYDPVLILKPKSITIGDNSRIDSFVKIEGGIEVLIGQYVHIASFCHINIGGGTTIIGDYVGVSSGSHIVSGSNVAEGESMSAVAPVHMQVVSRLTTHIREFAFLGVGCTVLPGVVVGCHAVIGAGAVVTKDVPSWEIWAGVPAKKIGVRPH